MGQSCPDRSSESLKKGALLMSEETQEDTGPFLLEVFSFKHHKQYATNAEVDVVKGFTLGPVRSDCQSYAEGHHFHWIPVFKYTSEKEFAEVRWLDDQAFEVNTQGKTLTWYHHDAERLKEALEKCRREDVMAIKDRPWIFIWCGDGCYAFNCSEEPIETCN
jgi:hypothetical protein